MSNAKWKARVRRGKALCSLRSLSWGFCVSLFGLLLPGAGQAQSCNPAVVSYIVRDESGKVLTAPELQTIAAQLPKQIGDATTSVDETSFAPDNQTFYWPESAGWEKGIKQPSLQFSNAGICAMRFSEITLVRNNKKMRLIFDIEILRFQPDRRPVVDSLPFQGGTFRLDLRNWTHDKDKLIPAARWRRIRRR